MRNKKILRLRSNKTIKKDQVLCEYLRADWLRLVGILPDLWLNNSTDEDKNQGQIDDVKIHNYVLTTTQIKELFTGGAVRFGPSTGAP